jgi:hypothetical protein
MNTIKPKLAQRIHAIIKHHNELVTDMRAQVCVPDLVADAEVQYDLLGLATQAFGFARRTTGWWHLIVLHEQVSAIEQLHREIASALFDISPIHQPA